MQENLAKVMNTIQPEDLAYSLCCFVTIVDLLWFVAQLHSYVLS